jgi:hypothetical protein
MPSATVTQKGAALMMMRFPTPMDLYGPEIADLDSVEGVVRYLALLMCGHRRSDDALVQEFSEATAVPPDTIWRELFTRCQFPQGPAPHWSMH